MKIDLFQSCGHCWVFQICWHIECNTFTASSFRIWNGSTGIPSPPLALFAVMFLRPTWLRIPGCLALDEWSHHHDYFGREDLFCVFLPPLNIVCFCKVHTISVLYWTHVSMKYSLVISNFLDKISSVFPIYCICILGREPEGTHVQTIHKFPGTRQWTLVVPQREMFVWAK